MGHDEFFGVLRHYYPCTTESLSKSQYFDGAPARCVQSLAGERKDIALVGDSHAEHMFIGLAEHLKSKNVVSYFRAALPMPSEPYRDLVQTIIDDPNISIVVLGGFWYRRLDEVPRGSSLEKELTRLIEPLLRAKKKVYLLDDVPYFTSGPLTCKYAGRWFLWPSGYSRGCDLVASAFERQAATYRNDFQSLTARFKTLSLIRFDDLLCDEKLCHMDKDGMLLFRDTNHLNIPGSRYLGRVIADQIRVDELASHAASPARTPEGSSLFKE